MTQNLAEKPKLSFSIQPDAKGFTVIRNGDAILTPRGLSLAVPTEALANAILEECREQGDRFDLKNMFQTQMALTSIDISVHHREEVIDGIMRYGENELICQRATEPADLVEEQNRIWNPYLEWVRSRFNAELKTGTGIVPFLQNEEALKAIATFVRSFDPFRLTAISEAVGMMGSLVLGLAFVTGHTGLDEALKAAELDHLFQAKKWGSDPANENRYEEIKQDLERCKHWLQLLG